ncbi:hypothetical protein [Dyella caseinilytica]|uniref:Uncharacterized protein n=1 Tax=Dyella caseinilytica TaxID=1849581 RepID=A0ABX7GQL6_9GAMM|nr:hypothetical protein [Dyella caseinilytica]QRN52721.1 hypothetical protein ISN74_14840 [Dyella caseinilytica]
MLRKKAYQSHQLILFSQSESTHTHPTDGQHSCLHHFRAYAISEAQKAGFKVIGGIDVSITSTKAEISGVKPDATINVACPRRDVLNAYTKPSKAHTNITMCRPCQH